MFAHQRVNPVRSNSLQRQRGILLFLVLLALGSLACFTLTLTTDVRLNNDAKTQVGMQLAFEFDREVTAALAESSSKGGGSVPTGAFFSDLAKKGWKLGRTESGLGETASKEPTFLENLGAQGWKLDERKLTQGRIVTATFDANQLSTTGFKPDLVIKPLQVVLDESDPLTTTWTFLANVIIPPNLPAAPSSRGSQLPVCKPEDILVRPCQLFDPSGDFKLSPRLEQALKNAGPPKLVLAATLPVTVAQATVNSTPGGVIANGNTVRWTFPTDKPGTFLVKAIAHAKNRIPIIFLPGVAGSELQVQGNVVNTQVWPLARTAERAKMALLDDGITSATGDTIIANDIIRRIQVAFGAIANENVYDGFMTFLKSQGYIEGKTLFAFPYDWRKDNRPHLTELDRKINEAIEKSGQSRVILIAHSMGGLIARAYILSDVKRAAKIDSLITIGTPYWGSPKPFYALANGYTFGNTTVSQNLMKQLMQNWPAAYQLVLTEPFVWDVKTRRYLTMDETFQIRYSGLVEKTECISLINCATVLAPTADNIWIPNSTLVNRAREFYKTAGTKAHPTKFPEGVKQYVIIGNGVSTLKEFSIPDEYWAHAGVQLGDRRVVLEPRFGDGDGTVPLAGLEIEGATASYYVPYQDVDTTEHGALTNNKRVQQIVAQIIGAKPPESGDYAKKPGALFAAAEQATTDFSLHSDAHMRIIDTKSQRALGFNDEGGIDDGSLPGTFLNIDGVEYASVAGLGQNYQVVIKGMNDGKFTLTVNENVGATKTSLVYPEVAVKKGTVAQMNLKQGELATQAPSLQVITEGKTSTIAPRVTRTSPWLALPSFPGIPRDIVSWVPIAAGGGALCLIAVGIFGVIALQSSHRARRPSAQSTDQQQRTVDLSKTKPPDLPE